MQWGTSDMNKRARTGFLMVACIGLIGVGALIDAIGGIAVRTNIAPDTALLTVFDPLLPGSIVSSAWNVSEGETKKEVALVLVTPTQDFTLIHTSFVTGNARILIPCEVLPGNARLELVGEEQRNVISSVAVEILPPGPDCVR